VRVIEVIIIDKTWLKIDRVGSSFWINSARKKFIARRGFDFLARKCPVSPGFYRISFGRKFSHPEGKPKSWQEKSNNKPCKKLLKPCKSAFSPAYG